MLLIGMRHDQQAGYTSNKLPIYPYGLHPLELTNVVVRMAHATIMQVLVLRTALRWQQA